MIKNTNKKRSEYLHSWLAPVSILLVAVLVFFAYQQQTSNKQNRELPNHLDNSCHFINDTCTFLINDTQAEAYFSSQPEAEESVTVTLHIPEGTPVESAWIEGVNMYMGKIPVLLEQQDNSTWTGWFMLGSCSEPTMNWQLRLNIAGDNAPVYMYFTTS